MILSQSELEQFDELGYVIKRGVCAQESIQPLRNALSGAITVSAERLVREGKLSRTYAEEGFGRQLTEIYREDAEAAREALRAVGGRGGGFFKEQAMLDFLRHPDLLECVGQFVGPEIVGSSVYRVRPKMPEFEEGEVPWHQDSGYFLPHCDAKLVLTCWIPMVDATAENGCVHVLPGTHKQGIIRHYTGGHGGFLEIAPEDLPTPEPVCCEMRAGDVVFMTNLTAHASFENRTDIVRWSVDLRYHSADVPSNVDEVPESYTSERDPVTMACYPPEADFIIKSPTSPEREVTEIDVFQAIRSRYEENRPPNPGRGWTPLDERDAT